MTRIPVIASLLLCVLVGLRSPLVVAQTKQPPDPAPEAQKSDQTRLKLADGSYIVVDEAWETSQGFWYRRGGMSHVLPKDRVKAIERGSQTTAKDKDEDESEPEPETVRATPASSGVYDKPAWIYLVGGARVEADSANQTAAGVWYKRGPLSIFLDRSRVDHIELEEVEKVADSESSQKERGWSTGNHKLDGLIKQNGSKYGVDPYLIFLVMEQESHFNPRVVSPKGARGLMQLMPGTSARFGVRRPHDPAQNISGGTRYLKQLLDRFNNRVDLVLASYNAGEGAVIRFGHRVPPYRETRNYVKRISFRYKRKTAKPPKTKAATGGTATAAIGER
ncbi:MAG TPA: lytic transglycosylase domain-containing protein [Pyrinomonadaceae bacterium]|nr:lytic transglycosylase domain-containing protein [Pyrinomonadaceae bacterium]